MSLCCALTALYFYYTKSHSQFPSLVQPSGQILILGLLITTTLKVVPFHSMHRC
jgi:hypothetical protein